MVISRAFWGDTSEKKQKEQYMKGKRLYTSKWSTKAAAHPDSTAHCEDVCVTVWILLIRRGGRGDRVETIEKQHIDEEYLMQYTVFL